MYTIEGLQDTFEWSYDQIRDRVFRLDDIFDGIFERGDKRKILITERGLSLLKKQYDLERSDKSIQKALKTIQTEIGPGVEQETNHRSKEINQVSNQVVVEELRNQVTELKRDKRRLEEQNKRLEERLLTGEVEEKERGPVKKFFDWLW